jgi:hypothetical protein
VVPPELVEAGAVALVPLDRFGEPGAAIERAWVAAESLPVPGGVCELPAGPQPGAILFDPAA